MLSSETWTALGTVASALLMAGAVFYAARAVRAQTFWNVLDTARRIDFSRRMDAIRSLPEIGSYEEFERLHLPADEDIRVVVDFLNDILHLIRHRYIKREDILNIYTPSIEACARKLLPWWLVGFRTKYKSELYYLNFQCLCENVRDLLHGKSVVWPRL